MTPTFQSPLLKELQARGFIQSCTNFETLDQRALSESITLYCGYDATAPSLQIGNLMSIMMLRIAQRHGHRPIVVVGGATTKLGDPTWKDTQRPLLSDETVAQNIATIRDTFSRYLNFDTGSNKAILVNNADWFQDIRYLDFLRDYGRFFSINRMITFDSVRQRLEQEKNLSFLEFNYMILQAYDFLHLYDTFGCLVQCGGSDQWGNIVNGVDLIRRVHQAEAFGLTSPLITNAQGQKMGKTEKGAVWLNAELLGPYEFWQFWRNVDDVLVMKLLKIYTDIPLSEIQSLEQDPPHNINDLKIRLADAVTTLTHGSHVLPEIHETVRSLFRKEDGNDFERVRSSDGTITLKTSLKVVDVGLDELHKGLSLIHMITNHGFTASNGEARRLIRGGGCQLNDAKVNDENRMVTPSDFHESILKVSLGKKTHFLVRLLS